ncbi:MAG: XrtA/PEP-CTERM system TPR-repeat protein PrsT [Thalassotalea sp.]
MNRKFVTGLVFLPLIFLSSSLPVLAETSSSNPYENALSEYQLGNVDAALIHVKNALQIKDDNLSARLLFAKILLEQGELAASEEQYQRALALKADLTLLILPYANVLLLQSKYEELLDKIKIGQFSDNINAAIYNYRAKALLQLQRVSEAKLSFTKAFELEETSLDAIIGLANAANAENDQTTFEHYLNLAKSITPNSSQVWFYQGEYHRSIKQNEQALAAFNQAITLNNDNLEAKRSRAAVNIDLANYPAAEQDIETILSATPDDPFTLLLKAFYLNRTNQKKQAEDILQSTSYLFSQIDLEKFDQFSPLLFIDGMTHYLLGDTRAAKKSLNQYLKKSPNSVEAKELLAEIALKENIPDKTLKILSTIDKRYYSLRTATLLMAANVETKNFKQAINTYQQLNETLQENGKIISLYTVALIATGESKAAIALIEKKAQQQPDSTDLQLMLGYHYLQYQFYDKALIIAEQLTNKANLPLAALNYIGVAYQSNEQSELSISYYQKALALAPLDLLTSTNLIQLYISEGLYDEALAMTSTFLSKNPNETKILSLHADCLLKMENISNAIVAYEQLNNLVPDNLSHKYQLINLYLKAQKPELALDEIAKVKKLESLSSASLIAEAKAYLILKQYAKSAKALNIAFGLNLELPEKLIKIAELQIKAQDWHYLDRTIKQIITHKGNAEQVAILKSLAFYGQLDVTSAVATLDKLKDKTYLSYYHLANFHIKLKRFDKATEYAELSYKTAENLQALQILTKLYWLDKQEEKALALLAAWLEKQPYDHASRQIYANLLSQFGDSAKAKIQYQLILKNKPDDVFSLNNLAMLLLKEADYKAAQKLAQKAVELSPLDAVVNDTLGWILVLSGKPAEGLSYLRESSARDVNNPTTKFHIATALSSLGQLEQAKIELKQIIDKSFPEQEQAKKVWADLADKK